MADAVRIGTAGWQLPKASLGHFPKAGTHLERYGTRLNAVEINSTFYRLPRAATLERWARSVPRDFRFALKMPGSITHERKLVGVERLLKEFLDRTKACGERLGPVLVQLPPSLAFTPACRNFLSRLQAGDARQVALEPRHGSWFTDEVNTLLEQLRISRVAADPPRAPGDGSPAGHGTLAYFRLHGTPRIYWSNYDNEELDRWAGKAGAAMKTAKEVWVIFDNTALGAATDNALAIQHMLDRP